MARGSTIRRWSRSQLSSPERCFQYSTQVVMSCTIKKDFQYNRVMPTFHHWKTGNLKYGEKIKMFCNFCCNLEGSNILSCCCKYCCRPYIPNSRRRASLWQGGQAGCGRHSRRFGFSPLFKCVLKSPGQADCRRYSQRFNLHPWLCNSYSPLSSKLDSKLANSNPLHWASVSTRSCFNW